MENRALDASCASSVAGLSEFGAARATKLLPCQGAPLQGWKNVPFFTFNRLNILRSHPCTRTLPVFNSFSAASGLTSRQTRDIQQINRLQPI